MSKSIIWTGILAVLAIAVAIPPTLAAAAGTAVAPLAPQGEWTVRRAALCTVQNGYAMPNGAASLALRFMPQDGTFEISLAMPVKGPLVADGGRGTLTLLPAGAVQKRGYRNFGVINSNLQVVRFMIGRSFLNDLEPGSVLRLARDDNRPVDLALTNLAEGLNRLRECENELLRSWGYDPAALQKLSRRAELIKMGAVEYPEFSNFINKTGVTRARFRIDATGKAAECKVVESSGAEDLDQTTCDAIYRARFNPARDADDKLAPDIRSITFHWSSWYE